MFNADELKKWKINNRLMWIQDFCMLSEQFYEKLSLENRRSRIEFSKELGYVIFYNFKNNKLYKYIYIN